MKHEFDTNNAARNDGKSIFNPQSILIVMLLLLVGTPTHAERIWYQPTPYPTSVTRGVHVWDGWVTNLYFNKAFIQDEKLQLGGWGDLYRTYIKLDTTGLPKNVTQAVIGFMPSAKGDSSTPTKANVYLVTGDWAPSMTWTTQPTATYLGWLSAPVPNQWWAFAITPWYNEWRNGTNNGFRIDPQSNNNNVDLFRSSRYASDGYRPLLQLDFTPPVPTPQLKIPLPGNVSWLVTTEIGGHDCTGDYDDKHDGPNYFAIDFSWRNKDAQGNRVYAQPAAGGAIPIMAAAAEKVTQVGIDPAHPNGYFAVLDHDADGTVATGFSTRYLHMKYPPSVYIGQVVAQGDRLGWMGSTGNSTGDHLHFGVRYNDDGSAARPELTYVTMDSWILKSFQTECANGDFIRYYRSTNRTY